MIIIKCNTNHRLQWDGNRVNTICLLVCEHVLYELGTRLQHNNLQHAGMPVHSQSVVTGVLVVISVCVCLTNCQYVA